MNVTKRMFAVMRRRLPVKPDANNIIKESSIVLPFNQFRNVIRDNPVSASPRVRQSINGGTRAPSKVYSGADSTKFVKNENRMSYSRLKAKIRFEKRIIALKPRTPSGSFRIIFFFY